MKRLHDTEDDVCEDGEVQVEEKEGKKGRNDQLCQHACVESQALKEVPLDLILKQSRAEDGTQSDILSINLKRNRLSEIGTELYSFTSLQTLDLSRNKIMSISAGISHLVHLERLILLSNKLKLSAMPLEEIAAMQSLAHIDLRCKSSRHRVTFSVWS